MQKVWIYRVQTKQCKHTCIWCKREHFNKKTKPKPRHSNNFKNFTVTKYIAKHAQPFVIHIYRNTVQFLHKTQFLTSSNICKYVHRSAGDSLTKLVYVAQKPKLRAGRQLTHTDSARSVICLALTLSLPLYFYPSMTAWSRQDSWCTQQHVCLIAVTVSDERVQDELKYWRWEHSLWFTLMATNSCTGSLLTRKHSFSHVHNAC